MKQTLDDRYDGRSTEDPCCHPPTNPTDGVTGATSIDGGACRRAGREMLDGRLVMRKLTMIAVDLPETIESRLCPMKKQILQT